MLEALLAMLAGLLIGSFLNVCIYRMPRDLSVVRPRSFCPACEKTVAWYDNVPVLSYALLRGRCRHCRASIPARYPVVELLTGILFFTVVYTLGPTLEGFKTCVFAALLVGLIFSDLEERILPDEFTLGGAAAGLVFAYTVPLPFGMAHLLFPSEWGARGLSLADAALGAVFCGGAMWLVGEVYFRMRNKEGLGFGDVKMVVMIGTFLGLQKTLLTLILGSLLGSLVGLAYIALTRKDASTYPLPFGSFLGIAALAVAICGAALLSWYGRLGS